MQYYFNLTNKSKNYAKKYIFNRIPASTVNAQRLNRHS